MTAKAVASVKSGDSYDNALAEALNSRKAEQILARARGDIDAVEARHRQWVREFAPFALTPPSGMRTPAEHRPPGSRRQQNSQEQLRNR